jgi:hypothetical protein
MSSLFLLVLFFGLAGTPRNSQFKNVAVEFLWIPIEVLAWWLQGYKH